MIVALEPENLFYMTGFWGEAIGILEKTGKSTIIARIRGWTSKRRRN